MMHRFIVLYHAPQRVAERFAQASPQEAQQGLQMWVDWAAKMGPSLIDAGKPLGNAVSVKPSGASNSDTDITGMSIVQAASMDGALEMVRNHHHLSWADSCEITAPGSYWRPANGRGRAPGSSCQVRHPVRYDQWSW